MDHDNNTIQGHIGRLSALETNMTGVHEKLDRILDQTTITNGRVGALEQTAAGNREKITSTRWLLSIMLLASGFLGGLLVTHIQADHVTSNDQVRQAVGK